MGERVYSFPFLHRFSTDGYRLSTCARAWSRLAVGVGGESLVFFVSVGVDKKVA